MGPPSGSSCVRQYLSFLFFFNDTATTEIYTLSLHDALPIWVNPLSLLHQYILDDTGDWAGDPDRKSTRLNSSHTVISYAVFCLKKQEDTSGLHLHSASHGFHRSSITLVLR